MQIEPMQEEQRALIRIVRCIYNGGFCELDVSQECQNKYKELYQEELGEDINCCRTDQKLIAYEYPCKC